MKKMILFMIIILFAGLIVFTGYRFFMVNTKNSIVNQREYLGNRQNSSKIYTTPSTGLVYSPLNIDIVRMDKLILINIEDDPQYACIELQTFDDTRGKGARVLLYRHYGPADSYYTDKRFKMKESEHDKFYINPDMHYQIDVTDRGVSAFLRMLDHQGKQIEFKIKETLRKKWSKGFLAPIGASDAILFQYFPFYYMKNMNFVRCSGTEIIVKIGGEKRIPEKLPVPVDFEFVYLSRYTTAPIIACWNRPHNGRLHPLQPKGKLIYRAKKTVYELTDNDGHYEIHKMLVSNEKHNVSIEFSPPIPDMVVLKDGTALSGRFCAGADGVQGIVAGIYTIRHQGNIIDMEIRPRKGWQPIPGPSWVKTWIWKSMIIIAQDNVVSIKSAWTREG